MKGKHNKYSYITENDVIFLQSIPWYINDKEYFDKIK
jgi:hypothetical protein